MVEAFSVRGIECLASLVAESACISCVCHPRAKKLKNTSREIRKKVMTTWN